MPEPTVATPPVTPPVTPPALSKTVPLSQQTGKILALMNAMPEEDKTNGEVATPVKAPVKPGEPEKPKEDVEDKTEPTFLSEDIEDDDETPAVTPFEVKTWQEYVQAGVKPLRIEGTLGDERVAYDIFSEDQLPVGFKFDSEVAALKYGRAFDRLERQAESLQTEFYQKQQSEQMRVFEVQQAKDIASDLKWLQSRGVVPKFEYEESDPRFNTDPAVKEADAIYELYTKTNNQYAQKYMGTGRSYRISYRDAADKYYASQSRQAKVAPKEDDKGKPEKTPIQKQRDNISGKAGAPQGGDAQAVKPKAFQGMSFADINRLARANKI